MTKGSPVGIGSVLTGLRGQTFTSGANAKTDATRGGTLFTVGPCPLGSGGGGGGGTSHGPTFRVTGSGKILGKTVNFEINVNDLPSGRLKYSDKEQHIEFASDRITGFTRVAANKVVFTGEATINGQKVLFTVEVEDNGEPGTEDRFKITHHGRGDFNTRRRAHPGQHSVSQIERSCLKSRNSVIAAPKARNMIARGKR